MLARIVSWRNTSVVSERGPVGGWKWRLLVSVGTCDGDGWALLGVIITRLAQSDGTVLALARVRLCGHGIRIACVERTVERRSLANGDAAASYSGERTSASFRHV